MTPHGADWELADDDLVLSGTLESSIINSIFSDARSTEGEYPDQPRGWWRDNEYGSLLWLIFREAASQPKRLAAQDHVRESLQWLVEEQIAETVTVTARWGLRGVLGFDIRIIRGTAPRWPETWSETELQVDFRDYQCNFMVLHAV